MKNQTSAAGQNSRAPCIAPRSHQWLSSPILECHGTKSSTIRGFSAADIARVHISYFGARANIKTQFCNIPWTLSCNREYFEDANICNAAYAHEWDPGGSRMLVVGGPLASGLVGSYCAMWR